MFYTNLVEIFHNIIRK